jgi:hypothetical protein
MTTTGKPTNLAAGVKAADAGATPSTPKPSPAPAAKVALKASKAPIAKLSSAVLKTVVKAPAKVAAKAPVKPAVKSKPKAPASATGKSLAMAKAKVDKPAKEKKPKLVRDSFTIPKGEYAVLAELKQRAGKLTVQIKKSELLRAGIKALAGMPDATFLTTLKLVPIIKTGRPGKD